MVQRSQKHKHRYLYCMTCPWCNKIYLFIDTRSHNVGHAGLELVYVARDGTQVDAPALASRLQ